MQGLGGRSPVTSRICLRISSSPRARRTKKIEKRWAFEVVAGPQSWQLFPWAPVPGCRVPLSNCPAPFFSLTLFHRLPSSSWLKSLGEPPGEVATSTSPSVMCCLPFVTQPFQYEAPPLTLQSQPNTPSSSGAAVQAVSGEHACGGVGMRVQCGRGLGGGDGRCLAQGGPQAARGPTGAAVGMPQPWQRAR